VEQTLSHLPVLAGNLFGDQHFPGARVPRHQRGPERASGNRADRLNGREEVKRVEFCAFHKICILLRYWHFLFKGIYGNFRFFIYLLVKYI
jgi:hypothetical protein